MRSHLNSSYKAVEGGLFYAIHPILRPADFLELKNLDFLFTLYNLLQRIPRFFGRVPYLLYPPDALQYKRKNKTAVNVLKNNIAKEI